MTTTLPPEIVRAIAARLREAHAALARSFPGDGAARQPVHTVYGGAHLFRRDTARKVGAIALRSLEEYGPDFATFARAVDLPGSDALPGDAADVERIRAAIEADPARVRSSFPEAALAHAVHARVVSKLRREPVEDYRIDFEDGYGVRADAEEDGHAVHCAREVAEGWRAGTLPPFVGIRVKAFSDEAHARAIRTLDLFLGTLAAATGGALPEGFVVTLPKVALPGQVGAMVDVLGAIEPRLGLAAGALRLEIMVETPRAVFAADGRAAVPALVEAARGRLVAAHFGTYDYTAACGVTAAHQDVRHPACDFAKHVLQACLAGTGVRMSDGATTLLPVAPHTAPPGGPPLDERQRAENRNAVHRGWRAHGRNVRHALAGGFYQGWDLHPAQIPARYAAVYAFFLEGLDAAARRLRAFVDRAARASLVGGVFDDAATGQGLLEFFLRGLGCGAITEEEAGASGLTAEEIRTRSFPEILRGRRTGESG